MESVDRSRVKTAITRSGLCTARRGGVLMNLEMTKKMKIIQFPENIDKFTSYFDKLLKTNGEGDDVIIDCSSVSYGDRLKQEMNILSKFIE